MAIKSRHRSWRSSAQPQRHQRRGFAVVTSLSGSGKSSLAFDTIYAEGQRRYVESLSAPTRDTSWIDWKNLMWIRWTVLSPRSQLNRKNCFAQYKVNCGRGPANLRALCAFCFGWATLIVTFAVRQSRGKHQAIVQSVLGLPEGERVMILAPIVQAGEFKKDGEAGEGFVRARVDE